jgi:hypothetical protein
MQSTKLFLILIASVLLSFPSYSFEVLSNWKLAKQSDDISISYRFIEVNGMLKTRQMQISFQVESKPEQIIRMFKSADQLSAWAAGTKKCKILQAGSSSWTTYSLYNIPWPFKQKDLITEYKLIKSDSIFTLLLKGKPNQLPYYKNISRIKQYEGSWLFIPLENGKTRVEFYSISFTKPVVPRMFQDPIIQDVFIDSINNLKTLLKEQV